VDPNGLGPKGDAAHERAVTHARAELVRLLERELPEAEASSSTRPLFRTVPCPILVVRPPVKMGAKKIPSRKS
jgi:hypothetical protein